MDQGLLREDKLLTQMRFGLFGGFQIFVLFLFLVIPLITLAMTRVMDNLETSLYAVEERWII